MVLIAQASEGKSPADTARMVERVEILEIKIMKNGSADYYEIWTNTGTWASLRKIALGYLPIITKFVDETGETLWDIEWRSHSEIMGNRSCEPLDSYEFIESEEDEAINSSYYPISDYATDAAREKKL
jgi:hypothetical protein